MDQQACPTARIPTATYRLQFNAGFGFQSAREIIGYLFDLGISDLYASSYLAAKAGSLHGYDIVDQTRLNPEVGSEQEFQAMVGELRRLGMGQILDFVPNHMCIESADNLFWMDLLENGQSSAYAQFFDIDWEPVKKELTGKVLLPFLGEQYGRVLERGELRLAFRDGCFTVDCSGVPIPLEPKSTLQILGYLPQRLSELLPADAPPLLELLSIVSSLEHLPGPGEPDPERQIERRREKEMVKKRLAQLCRESPAIAGFIEENLAVFNGTAGEPRSFDLLDVLLQQQVYRLSYWRVATEEINYRRFFDINALAAIRMEEPAVFDKTHALLFRLIGEKQVTGVRLDHVDGLYDPLGYLRQLQRGCFLRLAAIGSEPQREAVDDRLPGQGAQPDKTGSAGSKAESDLQADLQAGPGLPPAASELPGVDRYEELLRREPGYRPFYAVCEKILMKGEQIPPEWPVFGSTGYDFANLVNGLLVATENARAFDRIYGRFVGVDTDFAELVYQKKKLVMQVSLSGEINMLGHRLNALSERDRLTRDFTLNSLTLAISEVVALFPVYRTYVNSASVGEKDVQYIEATVARAKRKNPALNASVFDFLGNVLLLRLPSQAGEEDRAAWLNFAMRFQQITGPVMAKGLEDTAFYLYNRLTSLNDVGGTPGRFGTQLAVFHGQNLERLKSLPGAMIATATHDSKRGEDLRARIDVLSEMPERWRKSLGKWSRLNRKKETPIDGQSAPDRNEQYLLYQTLLGAWPFAPLDDAGRESFRTRISDYLVKAVREAKVNSSWNSPHAAYEAALAAFVEKVLAPGAGNAFLADFLPVQRLVAHYGIFNSLSQTLLKMVSPGIPDFYQGTELWDLSLVDPDNRGPVDYRVRSEALAALKAREEEIGPQRLFGELMAARQDGRIKLYLMFRVLNYRRLNRELFDAAEYLPLEAAGEREGNLCAFARRTEKKCVIAAVPRFMATLAPEPEQTPLGERAWLDGRLLLPEGGAGQYRNVITEERMQSVQSAEKSWLQLSEVFKSAPVALLERVTSR